MSHGATTPNGIRYHYNSDFSGGVSIVVEPSAVEFDEMDGRRFAVVTLPMADVIAIAETPGLAATTETEWAIELTYIDRAGTEHVEVTVVGASRKDAEEEKRRCEVEGQAVRVVSRAITYSPWTD